MQPRSSAVAPRSCAPPPRLGIAGDYARALNLIAQHAEPDDFVIATGVSQA
jgi:hypothetical protein